MKKLILSLASASSLFIVSCDNDDSVSNNTNTEREVQITFTANGPLAFAPLLFVAHDGSYDSFDTGSTASSALEPMAEVGDISSLTNEVPTSAVSVSSDGVTAVGSTFTVTMTISEANSYFSYVGMILPSSDTFIGNNDPLSIDLSSLLNNDTPIVINVNRLYDAGTEVNDFLTSPGGPLVGAPEGVATDGVDENGNITLSEPNFYDDYLNAGTFDVSAINPNGADVAQITITPLL